MESRSLLKLVEADAESHISFLQSFIRAASGWPSDIDDAVVLGDPVEESRFEVWESLLDYRIGSQSGSRHTHQENGL